MKIDPYKHKEKYEKWCEEAKRIGVKTLENEKIISINTHINSICSIPKSLVDRILKERK
jgi:hypothetical protein